MTIVTGHTQVGVITVRGFVIPVAVRMPHGEFVAEFKGATVVGDTLAGLREHLVRRVRIAMVKLDRPVFRVHDDGRVTRGVLRGFHAGNGNALVLWEGARAVVQEVRTGSTGTDLLDAEALTADEIASLADAQRRLFAARREVYALRDRARLDVNGLGRRIETGEHEASAAS
jgi:hypothetical protein